MSTHPNGARTGRARHRLLAGIVILSQLALVAMGADRLALYLSPFAIALLVWIVSSRSISPAMLRAATVIVSAAFAIVLLDIALRVVVGESQYYRPADRFGIRWPADPRLTKMRPNQHFEGEVHGDLAAMSGEPANRQLRTVRFATDERGYRNESVPESPADVIVLGDSFGLGVGTTQSETLDAHLARRGGQRIYNLSFVGGPWQELVRLKTELPNLPVRAGTTVLWLLFEGNDLEDRYREGFEVAEPNGPIRRLLTRYRSFRRRSPLRRMIKSITSDTSRVIVRSTAHREPFLFYRPYTERSAWTAEEVRAHKNFPRLRATLSEMKRFCEAHDLRVVVAMAPTKNRIYPWILAKEKPPGPASAPSGFMSVVLGLCAEQGIEALDLTPHFRQEARRLQEKSGEYFWWRDDTHWNSRGHELVARVLHAEMLATR
ncbi:MAG: alginate O-acetyltransferase AlgX-related protein [Planctomycetota bacterium]